MENHTFIHQKSELFIVLLRLFWLRNLSISVQLITIFIVHSFLLISLPIEHLLIVIAIHSIFNLSVYWRMNREFPVTEMEIAIHLGVDSLILAALLFYAGGSTNPFVSFFLVPIALSASFLSLRFVIAITLLCISLYSFLMLEHQSLPSTHGRFGGDFNLHIIGMWVNFILASILSASFITSLATMARERANKLAAYDKELLRNEYIVALGTLAAGTAHEISTPLSNIGMMADELNNSPDDVVLVRDIAQSIKKQQQLCTEQLRTLGSASAHAEQNKISVQALKSFLDDVINRWAAMRPEIKIKRHFSLLRNPNIKADPTITQAIINLLNNAADASVANQKPKIEMVAETSETDLLLHIDDFGIGFSIDQASLAGNISFTTKEKGLGLGLILSHASLARYHGSLRLQKREDGMRSTIKIPLEGLIDK